MGKERNNTIELFRFLFSVGFVFGHMAIIFNRLQGHTATESFTQYGLDTLAVFIIIAGFFMMKGFRRESLANEKAKLHAGERAWNYLWGRIKTLGVWFLVGNIGGFIALCLYNHIPLSGWFDALLNHIGEFFGLMLTGFNYGTASLPYGTASSEYMLINGPLWFVSGLFIASFILYYLMAKDEKKTLLFLIPVVSVFFYGSTYLNGVQPFWHNFASIGDFNINLAMIDMFCNLGIGCLFYIIVEKLNQHEFTTGMKVFLTIIQTFLLIFIPFRTLYPVNGSLNIFTIGWGQAYLLAVIFSFLLVLNKDYATKFLNRKVFGVLGSVSMHVYCLHYAIIILLYCLAPAVPLYEKRMYVLAVLIVVICVSIIAKILSKPIYNYLNTSPWFKKDVKKVKE